MNDRLVVLIGGLLAMVLVYVLLVPKPPPVRPVSRPTTTDTGADGYFALEQWFSRSGIATHSLRHRYDALNDDTAITAPRGNILLVAMPQYERPRFDEIDTLIDWVYEGNTLLILAAIHDSPAWIYRGDFDFFFEDLESITLAEFSVDSESDASGFAAKVTNALTGPNETVLTASPLFPHPLLAGVEQLHAESDLDVAAWEISMQTDAPLFALATDDRMGLGTLWEQRLGEGRIILSAYGSLLSNRAVGQADNRLFVRNLVRYHLGADGLVIFDDMHQGLSSLYDPEAFFSDPRLHNTLYFIVGFWLLYLVGATNRLGEPRLGRREIGEADFIRTTGQFIARRVKPREVGERMFRILFDDLRQQRKLPVSGEPAWDLMRRSPLLGNKVIDTLQFQYRRLQSGHKVDLRRLQNRINQVRKALL